MRTSGNFIQVPLINDMHAHGRKGELMERVVYHHGRRCAHVLFMPNTESPILTPKDVEDYRQELRRNCRGAIPLMTFKLLPSTSPNEISDLAAVGTVAGKFYPCGVTTNSSDGFSADFIKEPTNQFLAVLSEMEKHSMVLCLHGEVPDVMCLAAEKEFLSFVEFLVKTFPKLRIVLEHITTKDAVELIENYSKQTSNLAATITLHHLFLTFSDVVGDKLYPHNFCKPIAKMPEDRDALISAVLGGNPQFMFGSDSAPHDRRNKECYACCAGVFSAPVMLEMLVEFFDQHDSMEKYEDFCHKHAMEFYGLKKITNKVRLVREEWRVPYQINGIVPFYAGKTIKWRI